MPQWWVHTNDLLFLKQKTKKNDLFSALIGGNLQHMCLCSSVSEELTQCPKKEKSPLDFLSLHNVEPHELNSSKYYRLISWVRNASPTKLLHSYVPNMIVWKHHPKTKRHEFCIPQNWIFHVFLQKQKISRHWKWARVGFQPHKIN